MSHRSVFFALNVTCLDLSGVRFYTLDGLRCANGLQTVILTGATVHNVQALGDIESLREIYVDHDFTHRELARLPERIRIHRVPKGGRK